MWQMFLYKITKLQLNFLKLNVIQGPENEFEACSKD